MHIEICGGFFQVKHTKVLATLLAALSLVMSGCGTSDSIKSLLLTSSGANNNGFYNLAGQDSTLQLKVLAIYNSGKQIDVTNSVTWTVTPTGADDQGNTLPPYGPLTVPINKTGLMTGIVGICTWTDAVVVTSGVSGPANPPIWLYTGYYQTSASYRGFTSQPVAIGVGVTVSQNSPVGGCGPS
jgi:hypothetical protein